MANRYITPTLMLDTTQPGANGITAQPTRARVKVSTGASRKTNLSAPSGMTSSFSTNLIRSAKDCSRPNGPTTLGPLLVARPDLAVSKHEEGQGHEQRQDHGHDLSHGDQGPAARRG